MKQLNNKGFTIVELMIATTVLSVLLVLIATVSLQIGRLFYKGVSSSRTQETARSITSQMTRNIQYTKSVPVLQGSSTLGALCIGSLRYWYQTDVRASGDNHALWVDGGGANCVAPTAADMNGNATPTPDGQELLPNNMRLVRLTITAPPVSNPKFWLVDLSVALGEDDLLTPDGFGGKKCVNSSEGGQYCSVSSLKEGVYQWL